MQKRLGRIAAISLIVIVVAFAVQLAVLPPPGAPVDDRGHQGANIGGDYTLIDQDGQPVSNSDLYGKFQLIYFGFTFCPDICPAELAKMSAALEAMPDDLAVQIQPVFITLDPERDTPASLKEYLTLFHKDFIGLTGTRAEIDAVAKSFAVYHEKVQPEDSTYYLIDHASIIFLMSKSGRFITFFGAQETVDSLTNKVIMAVKKNGA